MKVIFDFMTSKLLKKMAILARSLPDFAIFYSKLTPLRNVIAWSYITPRGTLSDKELLAIRRIFSLVGMVTNTNFSNCPNVF